MMSAGCAIALEAVVDPIQRAILESLQTSHLEPSEVVRNLSSRFQPSLVREALSALLLSRRIEMDDDQRLSVAARAA
jgi:hypothetical protein